MVQYYTLEQAAQVLRITPDKLKEMAKKNEVRAFQDRGNLRFRAQEIDELARARGLGSDPELPLGDAAKAGPGSPSPRRKSNIPAQEPIVFIEDEESAIGVEPSSSGKGGPTSSSKARGGPLSPGKSPRPASKLGPQNPSKLAPKSPSKLGPQNPSKLGPPSKTGRRPTQTAGPKSPPPKKASDSDVRLIAEGSDLDFQVVPEAPKPPAPGPGPRKTRTSKLNKAPDPADSGVRIVPLDDGSDSDVKIKPDAGMSDTATVAPKSGKKPSDSVIRLAESSKEMQAVGQSPAQSPITEEIDLDEEQARADAEARTRPKRKGPPKPNPLNLPTSSPFELSEADIEMDEPAAGPKTPRPSSPSAKSADTDSSSDFELTPMGEVDPTPLEPSSSEQSALSVAGDDEVGLGELTGAGAAQSGINLQDPADSGLSLEQGGSGAFELSQDSGVSPKARPAADEEGSSEFELALGSEGDSSVGEGPPAEDSSSEFELALDSGAVAAEGEEESSSEFELSLDESGEASATDEPAAEAESDSEFELTLDPEGGLEASSETDALSGDGEDEKDIFETDFEVPALEDEESGSEAVAMEDEDTDLETSDFDLALDEDGASEEDSESGSQVVDLDEDEADEGAETEARPRRSRSAAGDDEGELDLEIDPTAEPEEDEEEVAVGAGALAAPPAKWGPLPALLMLPSVIVLFVVGLLTFELVGTMWGYRQPGHTTGFGIVLHPIAKYFDSSLPD